jgi:signal transduction histidine kinase
MRHLIDQLLDVAKLERGSLELKRAPCDVARLVDDAVSMFQTRAARSSIQLDTKVDCEGAAELDREHVLQVLSNLLANALKFTPTGGAITLAVRRDGRRVRFAVADSGPGIPAENVPKLFDRYWGRSAERGSLGLGLYICKQIVTAHGGEIGVETAPGAGTTFWFVV